MCGRYYRRLDKQRLAECFAANPAPDLIDVVPDYNVAPTTFQPVIRNSRDGAVRELLLMRWGLVPFFAKSPADFKGFSTFNAKAETVTTQATWREPFKRGRRCLVPADGYYEWLTLGPKEKQPYAFTVGEDSTFAFAGLWDAWHDKKTGDWLQRALLQSFCGRRENGLTGGWSCRISSGVISKVRSSSGPGAGIAGTGSAIAISNRSWASVACPSITPRSTVGSRSSRRRSKSGCVGSGGARDQRVGGSMRLTSKCAANGNAHRPDIAHSDLIAMAGSEY